MKAWFQNYQVSMASAINRRQSLLHLSNSKCLRILCPLSYAKVLRVARKHCPNSKTMPTELEGVPVILSYSPICLGKGYAGTPQGRVLWPLLLLDQNKLHMGGCHIQPSHQRSADYYKRIIIKKIRHTIQRHAPLRSDVMFKYISCIFIILPL